MNKNDEKAARLAYELSKYVASFPAAKDKLNAYLLHEEPALSVCSI